MENDSIQNAFRELLQDTMRELRNDIRFQGKQLTDISSTVASTDSTVNDVKTRVDKIASTCESRKQSCSSEFRKLGSKLNVVEGTGRIRIVQEKTISRTLQITAAIVLGAITMTLGAIDLWSKVTNVAVQAKQLPASIQGFHVQPVVPATKRIQHDGK